VEIFQVALQHAYLNNPDTLDPAEAAKPGREKVRRPGGEGTPEVTEFAAAELGARLGMSTISAWWLMADALDVRHRLPTLRERVETGEVRVYLARLGSQGRPATSPSSRPPRSTPGSRSTPTVG
jgi:hypothetical protein